MPALSHRRGLAGAPVIAAVTVALASHAAHAAMAMCEPVLTGEAIEDKIELQAKRLALESWIAGAGKLGVQYTRWGLAWHRQITCARTEAGLHRCQAVAHPCAIKQVPPAEFNPLRRGTSR
jgi:hypothetical protein